MAVQKSAQPSVANFLLGQQFTNFRGPVRQTSKYASFPFLLTSRNILVSWSYTQKFQTLIYRLRDSSTTVEALAQAEATWYQEVQPPCRVSECNSFVFYIEM